MTTKTKTTIMVALVAVVLLWLAMHLLWPILKVALMVLGAIKVAEWVLEAIRD